MFAKLEFHLNIYQTTVAASRVTRTVQREQYPPTHHTARYTINTCTSYVYTTTRIVFPKYLPLFRRHQILFPELSPWQYCCFCCCTNKKSWVSPRGGITVVRVRCLRSVHACPTINKADRASSTPPHSVVRQARRVTPSRRRKRRSNHRLSPTTYYRSAL